MLIIRASLWNHTTNQNVPSTATRKAEMGRLWFKANPGKKVSKSVSKKSKLGVVVHAWDPSYKRGKGGSQSETGPRQKCETFSEKQSKAKVGGGGRRG
jgi:hypothetical protein